ncbi:MAG: hypothetical protein NTW41_05760 [Verrucomicrobia bacterium]|nr:hypothetical protein [Verrucomicrobiota bacterium]
MRKTVLSILFATALACHAEDVLLLKNGTRRAGEIVSADATTIRLRVPLAGPAATIPGAAAATVGIPRADVESIEFNPDPAREERLRTVDPAKAYEVEIDWKRQEPWLSFPRSPAGAIGCVLGDLWLKSKDLAKATQALELFNRIEAQSWSDEDKARAKQGRLSALVALGRAEEAVEQAQKLAEESEDPQILIEAKNIMAQAAEKDLRTFLEENPRWELDANVIEERHRLYNRVLELYLYPALFFGSDTERSARGLWGAAGIYRISNQTNLTVETARDIVTLYPETAEAAPAKQYLASLKPEEIAGDFEAEARKEIQEGLAKSEAAPVTATPTPEPSPESKDTHKKSKNK